MNGEVPIEIEDEPTAITIMREQDTIETLKRDIGRSPNTTEPSSVPANASPSPSES